MSASVTENAVPAKKTVATISFHAISDQPEVLAKISAPPGFEHRSASGVASTHPNRCSAGPCSPIQWRAHSDEAVSVSQSRQKRGLWFISRKWATSCATT